MLFLLKRCIRLEIKFISDGKYLNLEPESERVILKKNHFHVHAAHHIICRELYAKQKQETKEKQQALTDLSETEKGEVVLKVLRKIMKFSNSKDEKLA